MHVPPQGQADSDHESMALGDDAQPGSPQSEHSHSSSKRPDSDSDSGRWSTTSNAPSAESQSENLKAAESALIESKGKAKVFPSISDRACGVGRLGVAQIELQSVIDPGGP